MTITSLPFLLFFILSLGVYYIIPKRFQWIALFVFSLAFFHFSAADYTIIYAVAAVLVTTLCTHGITMAKETGNGKKAKLWLVLGLVVNLGILATLKYSNFFINNINLASSLVGSSARIPQLNLLAPLGISFYTMSVVGYLLDVYWDICPAQTNLVKTALFVGYWPQLTSGPITRYNEVKDQLYAGHKFDSKQIAFGMQRMLWGIFKKLVISARLGVIVDTIYADTVTYNGFYIWVAAISFLFQLYTDFSGCMDIILGASECYGIILPENFRSPLFSRSVQEYWQRWHMTLGAWLKDYILYPVMRSRLWKGMTKWIKAHWGKKAAKQIPSILGMLCVWLFMGLWHGGAWKYIIGMGIWFWFLIAMAQVLEPVFKKIIAALKINTNCFSWHLFQSLRVFGLAVIGNMFFRIDGFMATLRTIKAGLFPNNPEIFFDGSLFKLGLDAPNFILMVIALLVLLIVSILQEKGSLREQIAKQNLVFRWAIWYALIFGILIFGMYGPGYDPADFIYRGF